MLVVQYVEFTQHCEEVAQADPARLILASSNVAEETYGVSLPTIEGAVTTQPTFNVASAALLISLVLSHVYAFHFNAADLRYRFE